MGSTKRLRQHTGVRQQNKAERASLIEQDSRRVRCAHCKEEAEAGFARLLEEDRRKVEVARRRVLLQEDQRNAQEERESRQRVRCERERRECESPSVTESGPAAPCLRR